MVEKMFKNEQEMIDFLREMEETDVRSVNYIDEASLSLITDRCPCVDAATVATTYKIALTAESESAIEEAVENTNCMWEGPVNGTMQAVPVSETAMNSLCGRAGLYGPSIKVLPTILNEGFALHSRADENKANTLVRRGMLMASHSSKYQWLPQIELVETNQAVFTDLFGGYEFRTGLFRDDITCVTYTFEGQAAQMMANYRKLCKGNNIPEDVVPGIVFTTSDVTRSGANLHPMISKRGVNARLGNPIQLSHNAGHGMADYASNCYKVLSLLQDSTKQMEKLFDIEILYPENLFQNAVKKFGLPVGASGKAFEDFTMQRPAKVTAHDMFWALWNTVLYVGDETSKKLDVEENLARIIGANWKALDTPVLQ